MASQPDGSPVTPTPAERPSVFKADRPFSLHPPSMPALGAPSSGSSHPYRFSDFNDDGPFSEKTGVSAEQAAMSLRAHLAETERRIGETGRLGTSLVQQQKKLTDRLREVEEMGAESELSPELKKKMAELEKEYDDVVRETARAFLPKQRIPSNESTGSPEAKSGRRSLSPVKYESYASGSPSKLSASNRKQRNQAANRVHDIEFAAEISTSLISQVRGLQALLAEREEELRETKQDLARLEDAGESFQERIKELDESEHRYKEENWNLETRIHELEAWQRDASDNEKKAAQQIALLLADKNKAQRELDELKASHARLADDHVAAVKQHDIELGTAKRNMAMADSERTTLQRRIDELAGQNQELAKAVAMQHRARVIDSNAAPQTTDDEFESAGDNYTPEHSPPASPVKGTPRHSVLESETLRTSLLHAQRTVQSLRTTLHREKTEKLEIRRMLQDARDELERARSDPNAAGAGPTKKTRKEAARDSQIKLRASQLGGARSSRTDLFTLAANDPDWEEIQGDASPSLPRTRTGLTDASDDFETANEAHMSDTSFATANDGAETTEDFHTGAENMSSGEDTMTETEQDSRRRRTLLARADAPFMSGPSYETDLDADADPANQSTASTSDDEYKTPRTPTLTTPNGVARMRLRVSRSSLASRRLRQKTSFDDVGSSPAGLQSSPFSAAGSPATRVAQSSTNSTPRAPGMQQSLFAELGDMDDSDEDVASDGTPNRAPSPRSTIHSSSGNSVITRSPLAQAASLSTIVTVDRATLTEPVTIMPLSSEKPDGLPQQSLALPDESRPSSYVSEDGLTAKDIGEKLKEFPSPPTSPPRLGFGGRVPVILPPLDASSIVAGKEASPEVEPDPVPAFSISDMHSVLIEPTAEPELTPEALVLSSLLTEHVTPNMSPVAEPPVFAASSLYAVDIAPLELPPVVVPVPTLSLSDTKWEHIEPIAEPEPEPEVRALEEPFSLSGVHTQHIVPVEVPQPEPMPVMAAAAIARSPVVETVPPPTFSFSKIQTQHVEPVAEPTTPPPPAAEFSLSAVRAEQVEPVATPKEPLPELAVSSVLAQQVEPTATPKTPLPELAFSNVIAQQVHPVVVEEIEKPALPVTVSAETQTDKWTPEPSHAVAGTLGVAAIAGAGAAAIAGMASHSRPDSSGDLSARSPKRNAFIIPRDLDEVNAQNKSTVVREQPATPITNGSFARGWSTPKNSTAPIIAEDETRQSRAASPVVETPESQRPLKELSVNAGATVLGRVVDRQRFAEGDQNFTPPPTSPQSVIRDDALEATPRANTKGFKAVPESKHTRDVSQESDTGSVRRTTNVEARASEASGPSATMPPPPLPTNHKENIDVARTGSAEADVFSGGTAASGINGSLAAGPSTWRARTPTGAAREPSFVTRFGTTAPKVVARGDMRPPSRRSSNANASNAGGNNLGTISRQTSMSSFASEVDARFHIHDGTDVFGPGYHTDPRMIQAITQTMIGEYLWKYTRKTGRSGLSENRHRRYFWIHPYTRMLYWSDRGPTPDSRVEQRAKSVVIEGVRVVTDDNPMPPGLHRKSLIVISPGRTIKFTCPTSHRHEIWFNALSYLLLRNDETVDDDGGMLASGDQITREDVDEFNPAVGLRSAVGSQARRRPPVSLSSYNSRTTRNESPAFDLSMSIPTLTPRKNMSGTQAVGSGTPSASARGTSRSRLGRIGGYWRSSNSLSAQFNSFRGRSGGTVNKHGHGAQDGSIYEASEVTDSAEELRVLYEAQDRAADRLENVRACCDGKHDVGMLAHSSKRHRHTHAATSTMSTPTRNTVRHRA